MADIGKSAKTTTLEKIDTNEVSKVEPTDTEKLSTKITNIPMVNSSLKTVSETCHSIKESNSYVGYGMTVAESSLDKAFKAGMAVLDSRTLAPITSTALEKVRYLDKEAGVMVDRFLKSKETERNERQANGAVQDIPESTESASLAARSESFVYFLGRKFFEVTSFLMFLPYLGPKYALTSIWGLFQSSSKEVGRKRKERGSMSEEVKYLEPSPVKRKYADRQSTSSDEGTLVEVLKDYVSEDDPDYQPGEHESEETTEESEHENDRKEELEECLSLTQQMEKSGVPISPQTQKQMDKIKSDAKEMGIVVSPEMKLKSDAKESDANKSQSTSKNDSEKAQLSSTKDQNEVTKVKTDETTTQAKTKSNLADSTANDKAEQKMEEIPLKDYTTENKNKTEASKDKKESKSSKIDPSSKSRRSSKSPLLEKLLSPGRRSRKSQKDKTKSGEKEASEDTAIAEAAAEESASKSEDNTKSKKDAEKSVDDGSKNTSKTEEATKSKAKSETGEKGKEKAESSKVEEKSGEGHPGSDPLSIVGGPFEAFRLGGKKSK